MKSKKYWYIFPFILFLLPIGINALYLYDAWSTIFEAPSEWTKFWGGYLGAIISGIIAFIILHIQRQDNERENKANRQQNETENKINRKIAIYQLEKQRIDDVRNIYTQYITLINPNDLLEIALQIKESIPTPTIATNLRKPADNFRKANILVSLYPLKENSNEQTFIQKRTDFEKSYRSTLNDFHKLISWSNLPDSTSITHAPKNIEKISSELREIIKNTEHKGSIREFIYECASTLVKDHTEKELDKMCSAIQDYIQEEFKLLDSIIKQ